MDFDFRFKDSEGKWRSAGHKRGASRAAAFKALADSSKSALPAGQYMSRPRGRQKNWDLFLVDRDGGIADPPSDDEAPQDLSRTAAEWRR